MKGNKTIASKTPYSHAEVNATIESVKKNFDGLHGVIESVPEGPQKTDLKRWAADTYLAASKMFLALGFQGITA